MVAIPPTRPPTTANPAPEQQRSTPHTPRHAHTQPRHRSIRRRHLDTIHTNGGFYYHRHLSTACRRRVAALWSQFPPHTHPQPPTLPPSNNAAPRTPRATPIHNLTTAAFADATSTPPAPTGGFTTIDAPPRHVAGASHPYGRNSPHAPTHNRHPCARATTQHPAHPAPRPYTTSPSQHSQTPPRHHPRLSVNPSCAHTHTRTRCHPPHVQPPPQCRPRPPPNPSCKRVPSHGLVPHIMTFTCNNQLLDAA